MDAISQKDVRVSGTSRAPGDHRINISGLTELEQERLEGALLGQWWVTGAGGRLQFSPAREPAPAPTEDEMMPQWRKPQDGDGTEQYQTELFGDMELTGRSSSILIQHLCGYSYTPEGYKANAEFLESCGFACMRSRRGDDGRYWEIWFLPGLWAARGRLKEAIYGKQEAHQLRFALRFLRRHISFGTLDIVVQRLCQVLD